MVTIPLDNIISVQIDPENGCALEEEGRLILSINWKFNPEEDRDNQHNGNKKVVFANDSRDVITRWRDKIKEVMTSNYNDITGRV